MCRSCLNNATNLLPLVCPNKKDAIGGYDECMLRYSFRNIFGINEDTPSIYMWNPNNVSANVVDEFKQNVTTLLDSQRGRAVAGGSLRKFAAGNITAINSQTQDCSDCLAGAIGDFPLCCDGRQGGRVIRPSCNFRFESSLFYDNTADNSPPPPPPPPPPSTNTSTSKGNESNKSRTIIILVLVPIITFVVVIISFCIYKRVRKPKQKPESESEDEIRSVQFLQLDFGTIKVATDDFSDANKLGQGGFGVVYK
ncbi:putative receptor-like protein kinase At4g00960, partial [Fagus crenata]